MEGGVKTSARQTSSTARAFREMVPSAERARRMQQIHAGVGEEGEATGAVEAGERNRICYQYYVLHQICTSMYIKHGNYNEL